MVKWDYGNAWESFPVELEEIWGCPDAGAFMAEDLLKIDAARIRQLTGGEQIELAYVDPPWNQGNLTSFRTKAGLTERQSFWDLIDHIIALHRELEIPVCFMEAGRQNVDEAVARIQKAGGKGIRVWDVVYYRTKPSKLIGWFNTRERGFTDNFTNRDDDYLPGLAMDQFKPATVLDLCFGRGLTGRTATERGIRCYGVELHPRRLACHLQWLAENSHQCKKLEG